MSVPLRTKWLWVRVPLQSLKLQISRLFRARSSLTFRQLKNVDSLWNAYVTWSEHTIKKFFLSKMPTLRIEKHFFCSVDRPTIFFMLSCPQTNKLNWFCLRLRKIPLEVLRKQFKKRKDNLKLEISKNFQYVRFCFMSFIILLKRG